MLLYQLTDINSFIGNYEKKKQEQVQARRINNLHTITLAKGYKFVATSNHRSDIIPESITNLLPQSHCAKFENILSGEMLGIPFKLFDYESGQSNNHKQTILAFNVHQTRAVSPYFLVRPRRQNDVRKLFGNSSFVVLPKLLPEEYTLLALKTDKQAVRQVIDAISIYKWPQLDLFANITMCNGEWVIFYKPHQLLAAERESIERFLEIGAEIASAILYANRTQQHTW